MAARYANDVEIAKAHRDFELKKAHYDQEVQTKKAESDMAYELQVKKKRYSEIYIAITSIFNPFEFHVVQKKHCVNYWPEILSDCEVRICF